MGLFHPNHSDTARAARPEDSSSDQRDHLVRPSQVSLALQDLAWLKCKGRLYGRGGYSMTTTLLKVNPLTQSFIFEGCRTPAEQDFLLSSGEVTFSAWLRGVPIRFPIRNPRPTGYQGEVACCADFPTQLEFVERRRHPRVLVRPAMNFTCGLQAPDGQWLKLAIDNLSQTGVGLRSTSLGAGELPAGTVLHGCRLDFGGHGVLEASLLAAGHGTVRRHETMFNLIGCTFPSLTTSQRTFLQRLIYQSEMAGRDDQASTAT